MSTLLLSCTRFAGVVVLCALPFDTLDAFAIAHLAPHLPAVFSILIGFSVGGVNAVLVTRFLLRRRIGQVLLEM